MNDAVERRSPGGRDRIGGVRPARRIPGIALAALAALALSFGACGGRQKGEEASYTEAAQLAFDAAERAFSRRDYEGARARFTEVYNEYPYSQYAALAEFRIGDTYLRERAYPRAVESFRRFVRVHPTHQLVPEAQFKIALSYVQQMPGDWFLRPPSYERDLTDTENAHRALELFLGSYPDSEFAAEAREYLATTTRRLASYELYVAEFYARRDNARAAAIRAEGLVRDFPLSEQVPRALFLHARSLIELGDVEAGTISLRRLTDEYPEHPLSREANEWLAAWAN